MSQQMLKVLVVGLDNSGKTSIINTLEQSLASFHALKPTVSFEIRDEFSILGLPIKIWDLGGQKQYRDEYLAKRGFIFGETNLMFFVVDIQDPKRYEEAYDYFQKSVDYLINLGLPPIVTILLHKSDPEIKDTKKVIQNLEYLHGMFESIPHSLKMELFETTIYNREELSRAFVGGIFQAIPKTKVIQEALNDFMQSTESEAVTIFDENVLIIGESFKDDTARKLCEITGPFLSNMTEKLLRYNINPPKLLEAEIEDGRLFLQPAIIEKTRFYLVFFTKEKVFLDKITKFLPRLTEDLSSLIKYVVTSL